MNSSVLLKELKFKAIRSSGSGGQHVNKVSSKIELSFELNSSSGLTDDEKHCLSLKMNSRLTKKGVLLLQCGETRSQHKNKEIVIKRFFNLLRSNLVPPKIRKSTKPSVGAIKKRLESKQRLSLKKTNRKRPLL